MLKNQKNSNLMKLRYEVDFHPVGQGLFSSGTVYYERGEFCYVYDCGTSSSKRILTDAIISYKPKGQTLDMVAISHFDQDHISGLEVLLSRHPVRVLLLPAISLAQRLIIAFSMRMGIHGRYMQFLLDPVAYLASLPGARIEHIVFVPSDNGESVPDSDRSPDDPTEEDSNLPGMIADLEGAPRTVDTGHAGVLSVHHLKPGGRLVAKKLFEFVPYNDASVSSMVSNSFERNVDIDRELLLSSSAHSADRKSILSRLRALYDKQYGCGSVSRNIISLFLYASPLSVVDGFLVSARASSRRECLSEFYCWASLAPAVLYTGDGYLDTQKRLASLTTYLGISRIARVGCLQVMHHGSRHSWHVGLAKKLSPLVSVFSADPSHRRFQHPHAEVVRDFLPFTPMQVDKDRSASFSVNAWVIPPKRVATSSLGKTGGSCSGECER